MGGDRLLMVWLVRFVGVIGFIAIIPIIFALWELVPRLAFIYVMLAGVIFIWRHGRS